MTIDNESHNLNHIAENVYELSCIAESMQISGQIRVNDSKELFRRIFDWAKAFEQQYDSDSGKDYLLEIEDYARAVLLETYPSNKETTSTIHEMSFTIPNGIRIVAEINSHARGSGDNWSSIDVFARFPNGQTEMLCCADFETEEGNRREYNRLRVMAYMPGEDDPHVTLLPLKHRSIWLSLDEGTYDINVWDEDTNDRDERMEIGHIPTLEAATRLMKELIEANSQIIWTRRALQEK